jgi:CDP-diacylglycerol--serine O-phosphatidyltransferase
MQFIIGVYNLPGIVTFSGLFFSIAVCILSYDRLFYSAYICFILAGCCDLFDGLIARKVKLTETEQEFGVHIDTIIDMVSFGIIPVILLLHMGYNQLIDYLLFAFYSSSAAMRLAIYNQLRQSGLIDTHSFIGLPVTYSSLVFSTIFVIGTLVDSLLYRILIRLALLILGILFLIKIRIQKPAKIYYLIFPMIGFSYIVFWMIKLLT